MLSINKRRVCFLFWALSSYLVDATDSQRSTQCCIPYYWSRVEGWLFHKYHRSAPLLVQGARKIGHWHKRTKISCLTYISAVILEIALKFFIVKARSEIYSGGLGLKNFLHKIYITLLACITNVHCLLLNLPETAEVSLSILHVQSKQNLLLQLSSISLLLSVSLSITNVYSYNMHWKYPFN